MFTTKVAGAPSFALLRRVGSKTYTACPALAPEAHAHWKL